jgi:hypothetical protein
MFDLGIHTVRYLCPEWSVTLSNGLTLVLLAGRVRWSY